MLSTKNGSGTLAVASLVILMGLSPGYHGMQDGGPEETQEAQVYRGTLEPLNGSGVEGETIVRRSGEELAVQVNARGLASGTHPQHIHDGESCVDFGGVAVPLDSDLGSMSDGSFPSTEGESGSLTYNESGTNADFAELDLGIQTIVVHATDGTPVACAALERRGE